MKTSEFDQNLNQFLSIRPPSRLTSGGLNSRVVQWEDQESIERKVTKNRSFFIIVDSVITEVLTANLDCLGDLFDVNPY